MRRSLRLKGTLKKDIEAEDKDSQKAKGSGSVRRREKPTDLD